MIVTPSAAKPLSLAQQKAAAKQRKALGVATATGSIENFLPRMRDELTATRQVGVLEATVQVINNASGRIADVKRPDLNLKLIPAMARNTSTPLSLLLSAPGGGSSAFVTTGGDAPKSMRPDETHFVVPFGVPKSGIVIPATGTYTLAYKARRSGKPKKITAMYDLTQGMSGRSASASFVARLPLFRPDAAATISKKRLPAVQLELYVRAEIATSSGSVEPTFRLNQASISVSLLGDVHDVMLAAESVTDHNPAITPAQAAAAAASADKTELSDEAEEATSSATLPPSAAKAAEVVQVVLAKHISKTHQGVDADTVSLSCSIAHKDRLISTTNGQARFDCAEVGDVIVALAVLRLVDGLPSDRTIDWKLQDASLLAKLLKQNGGTGIVNALELLYSSAGRLPTLLELLTHTAGLPDAASVDGIYDYKLLEKLLPVENSSQTLFDQMLAKQLAERTILVAPPGSVLHPSTLGYAILKACVPKASYSNLLLELGMGESKFSAQSASDDGRFGSILTTTEDLARYMCCLEKAINSTTTEMYRLLPATVMAKFGSGTGLKPSKKYDITLGGWHVRRIKLPISAMQQSSKVVLYKIGQCNQATNLLIWVPCLSLSVSVAMHGVRLDKLLGKNHQQMEYGKRLAAKKFLIKHLLKDVVYSAVVSGINRVSPQRDVTYSREVAAPPNYVQFVKHCRQIPQSPEGVWKQMLERAKQFQGDGAAFYPMLQASREIYGPQGTNRSMDSILAGLSPIQIKRIAVVVRVPFAGKRGGTSERSEENYVLQDHSSGHVFGLAFDGQTLIREGSAALERQKLSRGCFRMHTPCGHTLGEAVTVHLVPCGQSMILCVKYRGKLYVTRDFLAECREHHEQASLRKHAHHHHERRLKEAEQFMPWKTASLVSSVAEEQEPVEAVLGALFAGLLGFGLGAATVGAYPPYYGYYPYWY